MDQFTSQVVPILLFTTAIGGVIAWSQGLCTKKKLKSITKTTQTNDTNLGDLDIPVSKKKKQSTAKPVAKPVAVNEYTDNDDESTKKAKKQQQKQKEKKNAKKSEYAESDEEVDQVDDYDLFATFLSPENVPAKLLQKKTEQQTKAQRDKAKREAELAKQRKLQQAREKRAEEQRIAQQHFGDDPTWMAVSASGVRKLNQTQQQQQQSGDNNDDEGDVSTKKSKKQSKPQPPKRITINVPIQFEKRFVIIGKGGETLKAITEKTGTWITVPNEDSRKVDFVKQYNNAPEYIKIEGFSDDCERAKKIINDLLTKGYSRQLDSKIHEAVVNVPVNQRAVVVGEKGSNIRTIQDQLSVKVIMPERTSNSDVVTIIGEYDNAEKAKASIKSLLRNGYSQLTHPDWIKRVINFNAAYRKNLIGVAGSVIKQLQKRTHCRISFPEDSEKSQVIITGSTSNIPEAVAFINKLQADLDKSMEENEGVPVDPFADDDDVDEEASYYIRRPSWYGDDDNGADDSYGY